MSTKGGQRQQEKRLKFQIRTNLNSGQDSLPFFQKLGQLILNKRELQIPEYVCKLISIEINLALPNYKGIPKKDPRSLGYKLRHLFE